MNGRYEIRDRHNPKDRGMRFTDLARAQRELSRAAPANRWFVYDRLEKKETSR